MLTVLIPAAGTGERFKEAGYEDPKPLVDVVGKPMLGRVIENLRPKCEHRFIVISRVDVRPVLAQDDINIRLSHPTEGAVDTLLKARDHLTVEPLLLGNCDQLAAFNVNDFIESSRFLDGGIVTFKSAKNHHSYVTTDQWGVITEIAEKRVISHQAVTGIYYFRHGATFLQYAEQVINANDRVNKEFYVSSVISRMVAEGHSLTTYDAPSCMLGTPSELQLFEAAVEVAKTL